MIARKNKTFFKERKPYVENFSIKATRWIGSPASLIFHTAIFIISFMLYFLGLHFETILLVLTTIVSLEAIYLSIFIQMSVNRQAKQLEDVSLDVEEIQEDVEEIQEDIDEIQEDVGEIQEDVDEIQEDVEEIQEEDIKETKQEILEREVLERIEFSLKALGEEISEMKRRNQK
jgi:uncharacterized membrane protein